MSEITKEVLEAWMAVQSKATEQMVTVADRLASVLNIEDKILDKQDKLADKIANDISKDIKESITKEIEKCSDCHSEEFKRLNTKLDKAKDDIFWIKTLIGLLGVVLIIAEVFIFFHK